MASSINASTSGAGGLITTADNTGILQLQSAGTTIATIDSTGLTMASGKVLAPSVPSFSAYRNDSSGNQSISSSTWTKVIITSEDWDSANCFDSTTNYRFTPNVAGYYQVNGSIRFNYSGAASDGTWIAIYKNGSSTGIATSILNVSGNHGIRYCGGMIYLNGSTDYIELYGWSNHASSFFQTDTVSNTRFSGFLARSA